MGDARRTKQVTGFWLASYFLQAIFVGNEIQEFLP
jgi:hypothetical protein